MKVIYYLKNGTKLEQYFDIKDHRKVADSVFEDDITSLEGDHTHVIISNNELSAVEIIHGCEEL